MPTSTRRQAHAHTRSRNEDTSETAVQITSDTTPPQADANAGEPDHDMEDDGINGVDEDDEEALGEGTCVSYAVLETC